MLSVFDKGPFDPCPAPFNLAAHVLRYADDLSDKTALSILTGDASSDWTYGALERAVRGTGTGLLQSGLKPGEILLMRLGNNVEFPLAYLGAIAAGLVPVPTSSQLTEAETAKIMAELSPTAVLRDPDVPCAPGSVEITTNDLLAMHDLPACDYDMGDPDRLAYIVYTSGTSGKPRAVAHAHRAIWARQMMIRDWYDLHSDDRLLHAGAFNWTYTLGTGLMDPWTTGATALIPEPGTEAGQIPDLLRTHKATIFAAAPGVYRKILTQDIPPLPTLRHGLSAGEKLSAHLSDAWHSATGCNLCEAFGMSECSTFISSHPGAPKPPGDVLGQPQTGRRVAILGTAGPVPVGEPGIIAIHKSDPGLMRGYLNAPDETAERFRGDWFLTGDQGCMDEEGFVQYLGRADDMMNAGGFRVSPLEVEAALGAHPDVAQVGAAQVEVKQDTFVIAAFYTTHANVTDGPSDQDLRRFASDRLARYKQPRAYQRLDTLPMGANGKLLRRALPALFKGPSET